MESSHAFAVLNVKISSLPWKAGKPFVIFASLSFLLVSALIAML